MSHLMWFRSDLRLHDQPALDAAAKDQKGVIALFIATPETWQAHDEADVKINFIFNLLKELQDELQTYNIPLVLLECKIYKEIPAVIEKFCQQHKITDCYFNDQYELDERKRDESVEAKLKDAKIKVHRYHDQVLVPPGMILNGKNEPFKVFTPFKRKWLQFVKEFADLTEASLPKKQKTMSCASSKLPEYPEHNWWPASEKKALARVKKFMEEDVHRYAQRRDFPAQAGTSRFSPYLAQGAISVKHLINQVWSEKDHGSETFLNELIWREFYKHVIYLYPHVCQYQSFNEKYAGQTWHKDKKLFKAWQDGQTGFPLIDASMRQLKAENWMHNRMRMNVAMFLTKLMGIDWRMGEAYFMQNLIDGDLSANNGGWQWSAGTGADAAPYFRIFNPLLQSEKFDPKGEFIRKYCPELSEFDNRAIHAPHARNPELAQKIGYPKPIIDYKKAREQALN